eukprot:m.1179507 g.1179507  ORF g.1179507 m.1179507 type:complete len:56 (+) comp24529_c0_seq45:429-596(+)
MGTPVPQQCHHPYLFNTHLLLELFYLMSTLAITKLVSYNWIRKCVDLVKGTKFNV